MSTPHVFETFAAAVEQRAKDGRQARQPPGRDRAGGDRRGEVEQWRGIVTGPVRGGHRRGHPQCRGRSRRRLAERRGPDARPLDLPPRHRVARSQLAPDRNRRGRVRLFARSRWRAALTLAACAGRQPPPHRRPRRHHCRRRPPPAPPPPPAAAARRRRRWLRRRRLLDREQARRALRRSASAARPGHAARTKSG